MGKECLIHHVQRRATSVLLALLLTTITVSAHSRYLSAKFILTADKEQKVYIDSIVQSQRGVFSARWSPRRQLLFVVYDKTLTSRRQVQWFVSRLSALLPAPGENSGNGRIQKRRNSMP